AERRERLTEGSHDEIDLVLDSHGLARTRAARTKNADSVRVVDEEPRVVLARQADDVRKGRKIPFHAVEAVHHDQLAGTSRSGAENALEVAKVVMAEPLHLAIREPRAVHDAGVRVLVENDDVALVDQRRDAAQVREVTGRIDERRLFLHELG